MYRYIFIPILSILFIGAYDVLDRYKMLKAQDIQIIDADGKVILSLADVSEKLNEQEKEGVDYSYDIKYLNKQIESVLEITSELKSEVNSARKNSTNDSMDKIDDLYNQLDSYDNKIDNIILKVEMLDNDILSVSDNLKSKLRKDQRDANSTINRISELEKRIEQLSSEKFSEVMSGMFDSEDKELRREIMKEYIIIQKEVKRESKNK